MNPQAQSWATFQSSLHLNLYARHIHHNGGGGDDTLPVSFPDTDTDRGGQPIVIGVDDQVFHRTNYRIVVDKHDAFLEGHSSPPEPDRRLVLMGGLAGPGRGYCDYHSMQLLL